MTHLPHFIGIGARRCASSRLQQILSAHPQISKPDGGSHYFSENASGDPDAYAALFGPVADTHRATLDLSVSYLYPENVADVPARIAATAPQAKLFASLRDPVARSYSDYTRSLMLDEIPASTSFVEACRAYPEYIERSKYHALMTPYWDRFGTDGVRLFYFEHMRTEKERYFSDMAGFFGVDTAPFFAPVKGETGHAHASKSPLLQKTLIGGKTALRSGARAIGLENAWNGITRALQPAYQKAMRLNARELKMTDAERDFALDLLRDDTQAFLSATGMESLPWAR